MTNYGGVLNMDFNAIDFDLETKVTILKLFKKFFQFFNWFNLFRYFTSAVLPAMLAAISAVMVAILSTIFHTTETLVLVSFKHLRKWIFATNSSLLIPISLQPVNLVYFKLWSNINIIWNIKDIWIRKSKFLSKTQFL